MRHPEVIFSQCLDWILQDPVPRHRLHLLKLTPQHLEVFWIDGQGKERCGNDPGKFWWEVRFVVNFDQQTHACACKPFMRLSYAWWKKYFFDNFRALFYCFRPCKPMRKHAFAGQKYTTNILHHCLHDTVMASALWINPPKFKFMNGSYNFFFLLQCWFNNLELWKVLLVFLISLNGLHSFIFLQAPSPLIFLCSSLHWLILFLFKALFIQWSVLCLKNILNGLRK